MADQPQNQPAPDAGPTEEKPIWAKNPKTGEVVALWHPESIKAAVANNFTNATQEEANAAEYKRQAEGWKGKVAAGVAGATAVVPFSHNIVRSVAPAVGEDMDASVKAHPWIHGAAELATVAATAGIGAETAGAGAAAEGIEAAVPAALEEAVVTSKAAGPARALIQEGEAALAGKAAPQGLEAVLPGGVEKAIIEEGNPHLTREALRQVEEHLGEQSIAIGGEKGVSAGVPTLARRLLGRLPDMAKDAQQGALYSGIELTNEKDLGHTPEEVGGHIMSTLFWGAAGGVVGGELMHGITKAASPLVEAVGDKFGKMGESLEEMSAAIRTGNDPEAIIKKAQGSLQGGLDAIDQMAKQRTIDEGMEAVRRKVGDKGMGELDAARIRAETAVEDAKANVLRLLGQTVSERGNSVRKISAAKLERALKSDGRQDVIDALGKLHEAGKQLQEFHEQMAAAGATGLEGLDGKVASQVDELLAVQQAMKVGIARAEAQGTMGQLKDALGLGVAGEIASHFGHHLLGGLAPILAAGKVAKVLWDLAPAEFKAARLAQLSRLGAGVDSHLERVAAAMYDGKVGKLVAPAVAGMSVAQLKALREDVNNKIANPQLAQDHLEQRAGVVQQFAPQAYGQMALQYGAQLQTLARILQMPQQLGGPFQPQYMPSDAERAKMSMHVAIVKDARVFEGNLAKGTATAAQAATYKAAHPARAATLQRVVAQGFKEGRRADAGTLKAMNGAALLGIQPRSSYSPQTIVGVQGIYASKASQQGGPGSRGGTGAAKALTANQMISLPGQRVANRLPK